MKRYFEFVDTKSSKFWEVWIEGTTMFTRFGKIGANGQTTVKEFPAVDAAQAALDQSIVDKIKKGYTEIQSMSRSKTSITNQIAILEEIVDGENYWTWEQSIDVEGVMDSLDAQDQEAIQKYFLEMLDSVSLTDQGYSSYSDVLQAMVDFKR